MMRMRYVILLYMALAIAALILLFIIGLGCASLLRPVASIESLTYINMDKDTVRNEGFLEHYAKHKIKGIEPKRFPGILVAEVPEGAKVSRGEYGCSLSHIAVLTEISMKTGGWHLVCEDDSRGNFAGLEARYLRPTLFFLPWVQAINLYIKFPIRMVLLNMFGVYTSAYLVTPEAAGRMATIIAAAATEMPCDIALHKNRTLARRSVKFTHAMGISDDPSSIDALGGRRS
jgi:hypothetical protein